MAVAAAVTGRLADVRTLPPLAQPSMPARDSKDFLGSVLIDRAAPVKAAKAAVAAAGGMPRFVNLKGVAAPLDVQNIDTDMIIPKQFLKTIKRTGLGVSLFYEMRYDAEGKERPEFVLNQPAFRSACILVAGDNFGCGSSREHAPWALADFGIKAIIASSFADIFNNNCYKNGMLPVVLPRAQVEQLLKDAAAGQPLEVDLPSQRVVRASGEAFPFIIDEFRKHCLLNGLDDIGLTLAKAEAITAFETKHLATQPWMRGVPLRVATAAR